VTRKLCDKSKGGMGCGGGGKSGGGMGGLLVYSSEKLEGRGNGSNFSTTIPASSFAPTLTRASSSGRRERGRTLIAVSFLKRTDFKGKFLLSVGERK